MTWLNKEQYNGTMVVRVDFKYSFIMWSFAAALEFKVFKIILFISNCVMGEFKFHLHPINLQICVLFELFSFDAFVFLKYS